MKIGPDISIAPIYKFHSAPSDFRPFLSGLFYISENNAALETQFGTLNSSPVPVSEFNFKKQKQIRSPKRKNNTNRKKNSIGECCSKAEEKHKQQQLNHDTSLEMAGQKVKSQTSQKKMC